VGGIGTVRVGGKIKPSNPNKIDHPFRRAVRRLLFEIKQTLSTVFSTFMLNQKFVLQFCKGVRARQQSVQLNGQDSSFESNGSFFKKLTTGSNAALTALQRIVTTRTVLKRASHPMLKRLRPHAGYRLPPRIFV
jgi:hypothetical protein